MFCECYTRKHEQRSQPTFPVCGKFWLELETKEDLGCFEHSLTAIKTYIGPVKFCIVITGCQTFDDYQAHRITIEGIWAVDFFGCNKIYLQQQYKSSMKAWPIRVVHYKFSLQVLTILRVLFGPKSMKLLFLWKYEIIPCNKILKGEERKEVFFPRSYLLDYLHIWISKAIHFRAVCRIAVCRIKSATCEA